MRKLEHITIFLFFLLYGNTCMASEWQMKMQKAITANNVEQVAELVAEKESEGKLKEFTQGYIFYPKNQEKITMLCFAALKGNVKIVELLMNLYTKYTKWHLSWDKIIPSSGYSPVHFATIAGNLGVLKLLKEYFDQNPSPLPLRDFDGLTKSGYNHLHLAILENKFEIIEYLVEADKYYLEVKDRHGNYPLQMTKDAKILELLSVKGAKLDIFQVDQRGNNLLIKAIRDGNHELAFKYIELGIPVDHKNLSGHTSLDFAFENLNLAIISKLLEKTQLDLDITTRLLFALEKKNIDLVQLLIKYSELKGKPIDWNNKSFLFKAYPDINLIDFILKIAPGLEFDELIEIAMKHEYKQMLSYFLAKGFTIKDGWLDLAKKFKNKDIYYQLLEVEFFQRIPNYLSLINSVEDFNTGLSYTKVAFEELKKLGFVPHDLFQQKFFNMKKQATFDFYAKRPNVQKQITNNDLLYISGTCKFCLEDKLVLEKCPANQSVQECNYAHFCKECSIEKCPAHLKDNGKMGCQGCKKNIAQKYLEEFSCDESVISEAMQRQLTSAFISLTPNWHKCRSEDCPFGKSFNEKEPKHMECNVCDFVGCLDCGKNHPGEHYDANGACYATNENKIMSHFKEQALRLGRKARLTKAQLEELAVLEKTQTNDGPCLFCHEPQSTEHKLSDHWLDGRYRPCPFCGVIGEKDDQCNHTTCNADKRHGGCGNQYNWNRGKVASNQMTTFDAGVMQYELEDGITAVWPNPNKSGDQYQGSTQHNNNNE